MRFRGLLYSIILFALLNPTLARPKLPPLPANTTFPTHYGVVVWPSFASDDVFNPVNVLNALTYWYPQLGMHFSILSATLDPVSTRLLHRSALHEANTTVAPPSDFGQAVLPTDTLDAVLARNGTTWVEPYPPEDPERPHGETVAKVLSPIQVLLVPGGGTLQQDRSIEVAFVKQIYPRLHSIFSVCTGATVLARSGILDGRRATSNKQGWEKVIKTGPNVLWDYKARWVQDGNIWTSAEPTAGIDGAYAWVENVFGRDIADFLAATVGYTRWRDGDNDPFADVWD